MSLVFRSFVDLQKLIPLAMAKAKRARDLEDAADLDGAHPDRKKRVKYTEEDAQLASIYNDLADEVLAVRIKAAGELMKQLSSKSVDREQRLDAAETRLIKGLCSGRKAARLGFSIALAEVFRLHFKLQSEAGEGIKLATSIDKVLSLTEAQGNVSGQERRDYLLGRRFAFQALLHSDVGLRTDVVDSDWARLMECMFELANQKQWLRRECGAVVYDYLVSMGGAKLSDARVKDIVAAAQGHKFLKTPEGVGLWIAIADYFPGVKLPRDVWHHRNPLSSKERATLSKVMLETSTQDDDAKSKAGARQITPSFAWKVLLTELYKTENAKSFKHFWIETVVNGMFSTTSSAERRSLGLQVLSLALATAPVSDLPLVLHKNVVQCILDQRAESNRFLFDAAKAPLNQLVERTKAEPEVAAVICPELMERQLLNFDQATKTKTVETLIQSADQHALKTIAQAISKALDGVTSEGATSADSKIRQLADFTLSIVRQRKEPESILLGNSSKQPPTTSSWLSVVLTYMVKLSYDSELLSGDKSLPRARLMSCLNFLLSRPLDHAINAPVFVVQQCSATVQGPQILERSIGYMNEAYQLQEKDSGARAFALLFSLSIIQVHNEEPDAQAALDDLTTCYESRNDKGDSLTMLIELLLSFISKPSALFRKLAEQAFSAFAEDLTADALQSLLDILGQKESLKGQQELFDENGGDDDDAGSASDEDEDGIDVEHASDVELVNGEEASASDSDEGGGDDSSDDESSAEADAGAEEEDDEEAAFNKKLAEALGTTGMDEGDSSDSGSDMDDEQMMALEPHLTTIFQERQKQTSKKQDKKDAKENIVNFKNRVLDLLAIYVKSQYGNVLAMDLILPLCVLVRTTTNKQTGEKAFGLLRQYFDLASKHKALPGPEDHGAVFAVQEAVHAELKQGGSKLHANACSRSSLFLAKVLVGLDRGYYERIARIYAKLQAEWWLGTEGGAKVQGSVFTEWVSWSIGTRKIG